MKIVRATVQYTALPEHVVIEGMPTQVKSKVLGVFGANALIDTETNAVVLPRDCGTGVLGYLEQLGVAVNRTNQMSTAEEHQGVMVCLYPAKEVAEKFAVDGGESVENMHVTLAYLGKTNELPEDALNRIVNACTGVVSNQPELSGEIGGIGRWAAGDKDCIYASVDIPGSNELRARLCGALQEIDIPARENHGWSAHMTIQYIEPGLDVKVNHVDPVKVSFGSIWVVSGDKDRKEIKFGHREAETAEASLDSFMSAYMAATSDNPFSERHRVWFAEDPKNIVQTEVSEFDGQIHIGAIFSPNRGKGNATKVMEKLAKLADQHQVNMALEAQPFGRQPGTLDAKQLQEWYKKFGFVYHEFSSEDEPLMVRAPKTKVKSKKPAKAFNVTQRRRIARDRSNDELETILRNAQDKHVSPENVKKVLDCTGLDVTKTADQQKLREKLGLSGEPGVTAAFERQIQNKLGWW